MILVAGGTGRLGSIVVSRLADRGSRYGFSPAIRIRRSPPGRENRDRPRRRARPCERRSGDARRDHRRLRGAGLRRARPSDAGVGRSRWQCQSHWTRRRPSAHVVLMSVVGRFCRQPDGALPRQVRSRAVCPREWHALDRRARHCLHRVVGRVDLEGVVFGRGDNPINFVSVRDVAAVVEHAVVDSAWRARAVEVGGPQNLTFNELAALVQEVRGHPQRIRHVPRGAARAGAARPPTAGRPHDGHRRHDLRRHRGALEVSGSSDDRRPSRLAARGSTVSACRVSVS